MSKHTKITKFLKGFESTPSLTKGIKQELKREDLRYQKHRNKSKGR